MMFFCFVTRSLPFVFVLHNVFNPSSPSLLYTHSKCPYVSPDDAILVAIPFVIPKSLFLSTYITWYLYHSLSHQITSTVVLHLDVMGISTVIYSYNYSLCSKKMSGHGLVKFSGNSVILFIIPITLNFTWDQKY